MSQDQCECITEARGVELRSQAEIEAERQHYKLRAERLGWVVLSKEDAVALEWHWYETGKVTGAQLERAGVDLIPEVTRLDAEAASKKATEPAVAAAEA